MLLFFLNVDQEWVGVGRWGKGGGERGRTNERPGTDHVTSGLGIKRSDCEA